MICLGTPQIAPDQMMSKAAQDYAVAWSGTTFCGFTQPESSFPS